MSHDKIKAAARRRMARTGESYTVARLAVIREHREAQEHARQREAAEAKAFEDVAIGLARNGEHVRAQLAYPGGLAEIQRRFAAEAARAAEVLNAPAVRMSAEAARAAEVLDTAAVRMSAEAARAAEVLSTPAVRISAEAARAAEVLNIAAMRMAAEAARHFPSS